MLRWGAKPIWYICHDIFSRATMHALSVKYLLYRGIEPMNKWLNCCWFTVVFCSFYRRELRWHVFQKLPRLDSQNVPSSCRQVRDLIGAHREMRQPAKENHLREEHRTKMELSTSEEKHKALTAALLCTNIYCIRH